MPCTSARARQLLRDGKAATFRGYPFTIILKDRAGGDTQPLSLNVDPGSKATGDMVLASVPTGKKQGVYVGRVTVRSSGSFNVQTKSGVVQGVSHKHCRILQRSDGYNFTYGAAIPLCPKAQSLLAETR